MDTSRSVVDGGEARGQPIGFDLLLPGAYRRDDAHINVRKCFEEAFRMSRRQPRRPLGLLAEVVVAPLEYPFRLLHAPMVQVVGLFLAPLEASLGTVNPDAQVVLLSGRNLRGEHDALGATLVADQEVTVVVETSALDESSQVGADFGYLEAGNRVDQVFGMGAYISYGSRYPRTRWVGAPLGLLGPGLLHPASEPPLAVLDDHLPAFAPQPLAP